MDLKGSKEIKEHLEKYAWLNCKFLRYSPYGEKEILERITNFPNPKEELKKIENSMKDLETELDNLILEIRNNDILLKATKDMQKIFFENK